MKDFEDFSEYFPAAYGRIVEEVRNSVEKDIVEETTFGMDCKDYHLLYLMVGKISAETTVAVLREYHRWLSEK